MQVDFLIIGQGLAGSLLAWALMQRQCKVVVVDPGYENASQVAAGIINPITGLRFVKAEGVDQLLPEAMACYASLSTFFQQPFYVEKPMLRFFRNPDQAKAGKQRLAHPDYQAYLDGLFSPEQPLQGLEAIWGGLRQKQTGYLLTVPLLNALRKFFIAQGCYRQAVFNYADLSLQPRLCWQDIVPLRVIFCEGYQLVNNPWFSWLPLQPVKGEILTLQSAAQLPEQMLNYGNWLLPLENNQFRLGATFERDVINTEPTKQGRALLLNNLKPLSAELASATVIRQQANIRPCSLDRQPLIGQHPHKPMLSVFNGFGAKGSLSLPWYCQHFADVLLTGKPLATACDVRRYYNLSI